MKYISSILLLVLFFSCKGQPNSDCLVKLENKLMPVLNKKEIQGEIINFRDSITCLDWDSLLIESGYATKESIKKYYGLEIPYYFSSSSLDSEALIFFIKRNKIIDHIKFSTTCARYEVCKTYDFKRLMQYNKKSIIAIEDAVFEVYTEEGKDNQGHSWQRLDAIRIKK